MTEPSPAVVVPAGEPLLAAAAWIGASCRAELELHARLTAALAAGVGAERSPALWTVRAHRAEVAEAWHRRLPELREMPRESFVEAGSEGADVGSAASRADDAATTDGANGAGDLAWLVDDLDALLDRYRAHVPVAVGPADGPTADTLRQAIATTELDRRSVAALLRFP